jgi:hypothetical protein
VRLSQDKGQGAGPAADGAASISSRRASNTLQGGIDFIIILPDAINREIAVSRSSLASAIGAAPLHLAWSAQRLGKLIGAPRLDQSARISIRQNLRDSAYRRGDERTARLACFRDPETEGLGMGSAIAATKAAALRLVL